MTDGTIVLYWVQNMFEKLDCTQAQGNNEFTTDVWSLSTVRFVTNKNQDLLHLISLLSSQVAHEQLNNNYCRFYYITMWVNGARMHDAAYLNTQLI
jgi:hypothetical protein